MTKRLIAIVLLLGLAAPGCEQEIKGDCEKETVGNCGEIDYCCNVKLDSLVCWYEANGKKYSCKETPMTSETDCAQALADLQADCQ